MQSLFQILLFFPTVDSGDVSSIKDVATLELLIDLRPTKSSWAENRRILFIYTAHAGGIVSGAIMKTQSHTDVRVRAVQLSQARGFQELLPLRYRLRP